MTEAMAPEQIQSPLDLPTRAHGSLYVGDLDPQVKEEQLIDLFRQCGPVLSVRICRDVVTQKPLGYAYVNYHNQADAEKALQTLNFTQLGSHYIRVMWQQRDPSVRYSGSGNVFIKNIDAKIDGKGLFDLFSAFGKILSCKVMTDESGQSRRYGFVHFDSENSANAAIEKFNGNKVDEEAADPLVVAHFIRRNARIAALIANFTNLYIKQVLPEVDTASLQKFFSKFGGITSIITKKDSKGRIFGFCNFSSHTEAVKAIEELHDKSVNGLTIPGEKVYVQRAQARSERLIELRQKYIQRQSLGNNLYVRNFDVSFTVEELKDLFKEFGEITSATIVADEAGISRGFGFVCFKTAEEANQALRELNGRVINSKPLFVNVAQRKDHRHSMLQIQFQHRLNAPMMRVGMPFGFGAFGNPRVMPPHMRGQKLPPMAGAPPASGQRPRPSSRPTPQQTPVQAPTQPYTVPRTPQTTPQLAPQTPPLGPISAQDLRTMSVEEQKTALGERLFFKVYEQCPEYAPKITGMFLEMELSEALSLLDNPAKMKEKVEEAICVLQVHQQQQQRK